MKHLKIFEQFVNEFYQKDVKLKWSGQDFKNLYDQLSDKAREASAFLEDMGNPPSKTYVELLNLLDDYDTEESFRFAHEIRNLIGMMQHFGIEQEIELSQLN